MNPQIDILLSTYNGADYIEEQINSIFNQTYKNLEVVIVDDLSTGNKEFVNSKAKFYKLDIRDEKLKNIFKDEKHVEYLYKDLELLFNCIKENFVGSTLEEYYVYYSHRKTN